MPSRSALLFLHAESPVHAGTGASAGVIDLPIQRATHTAWPIINDSTLKGAFRRALESARSEEEAKKLLGSEDGSGRIAIPDASILLFPVAAPKGVMTWITCARALRALKRQLDLVGASASEETRTAATALSSVLAAIRSGPDSIDHAWVATKTCTWADSTFLLIADQKFDVPADTADRKPSEAASALAEWLQTYAAVLDDESSKLLIERVAILHDDAFTHFTQSRTEVRTRIVIDEGKAGNLWTEENLPVDSLMYLTVTAMKDPDDLNAMMGALCLASERADERQTGLVQLGGDQGLGRGWFRVRALCPSASKAAAAGVP
jgi:CRISPR-associated protein Cmr4